MSTSTEAMLSMNSLAERKQSQEDHETIERKQADDQRQAVASGTESSVVVRRPKSIDEIINNLPKEDWQGVPYHPIIAAIRKIKDPTERLRVVTHILEREPEAIHAEHFNKNYDTYRYTRDVNYNTTTLIEAIHAQDPTLLEFLCQRGAKVNYRPAPKNKDSIVRNAMDVVLFPTHQSLGIEGGEFRDVRNVYLKPQLIKILIKYGAKTSDGKVPKPCSMNDFARFYQGLQHLITTAYETAQTQNKKLIIFMPELDSSKYCLMTQAITLYIMKDLGIKNLYTDYRGGFLLGLSTWKREPQQYFNMDHIADLATKLNIETIQIEHSKEREYSASPDLYGFRTPELLARSKDIKLNLEKANEHGLFILNLVHLYNLTQYDEFHLDKDKFITLAINVCLPAAHPVPSMRENFAGHEANSVGNSVLRRLEVHKMDWQPELYTGEEIIRFVSELQGCPSLRQAMVGDSSQMVESINELVGWIAAEGIYGGDRRDYLVHGSSYRNFLNRESIEYSAEESSASTPQRNFAPSFTAKRAIAAPRASSSAVDPHTSVGSSTSAAAAEVIAEDEPQSSASAVAPKSSDSMKEKSGAKRNSWCKRIF